MLHHEFEELVGRKADQSEYQEANAIYMAAGDIDKQTLCNEWETIKASKVVEALALRVRHLEDLRYRSSNAQNEVAVRLVEKCHEHSDITLHELACQLSSPKDVLLATLDKNLPLTEADAEYIRAKLH